MKDFTQLLREYINEIAISTIDGKNYVSPDKGDDFILKDDGKKPWVKKISSTTACFSVYKIVRKEHNQSLDPINVVKALKNPTHKGNITIPRGTIDEILQNAVQFVVPWLLGKNIDVITTPQSSKTLAIRFGKEISKELNLKFIPAGTIKNLEGARLELPNQYPEKSAANLRKNLERMKRSDEKSIRKAFHVRDRKFIRDWQKLRNDSFVSGNRVLLVDDVITDGSTLLEMERNLESIGVNVVGCVTLFRAGS